jgi:hypothetical protein
MKSIPWIILAVAALYVFLVPMGRPGTTEIVVGIFLCVIARMVQAEVHHREKTNQPN